MPFSEAHKGVRKLRIYLYRQLKLLRKGLVDEALFLFEPIEKTIIEISQEKIDDAISREILIKCQEMNEEILARLNIEKNGIARNLFRTEVERKIREFLD